MLMIAICDDNKAMVDVMENKVTAVYRSLNVEVQVDCYYDGGTLISGHTSNHYDAIFLDISMPDQSGFSVSEKLRSLPGKPYIIFVTSKDELVYEAFDYMPFYFIRKKSVKSLNLDIEKVIMKLNRFIVQKNCLIIDDYDMGQLKIEFNDIIYIKSDNHYLILCNKKTAKPVRLRGNIKEKEIELSDSDFARIHKQYLVNLRNASKINVCANLIIMCNGDQLPISKNFRENFYCQYKAFLRDNL